MSFQPHSYCPGKRGDYKIDTTRNVSTARTWTAHLFLQGEPAVRHTAGAATEYGESVADCDNSIRRMYGRQSGLEAFLHGQHAIFYIGNAEKQRGYVARQLRQMQWGRISNSRVYTWRSVDGPT